MHGELPELVSASALVYWAPDGTFLFLYIISTCETDAASLAGESLSLARQFSVEVCVRLELQRRI